MTRKNIQTHPRGDFRAQTVDGRRYYVRPGYIADRCPLDHDHGEACSLCSPIPGVIAVPEEGGEHDYV